MKTWFTSDLHFYHENVIKYSNGRMLNIGVDVWDFNPLSLEQVLKIIPPKKI